MTPSYKKIVAKSLFIFTLFILFTGTIHAQSWQWLSRAGGTAGGETGRAACTDASGNAYFCGNFTGASVSFGPFSLSTAGGNDVFITKFNAAGVCQWAVRAGGTTSDLANGIVTDGTSVYVTGGIGSTPGGASFGPFTLFSNGAASDGFIAKLDAATGAWTWAVNFSNTTTGGDIGHAITLDGSGNPYICGNFSSTINFGSASYTSGGTFDFFVAKINPANGAFVWGAVGGGITSGDNVVGSSLCYVPGLNEIVAGSSFGSNATYYTTTPASGPFNFTNSGGNDIVLLEMNASTGAILSATQHSGSGGEDCLGMCYDPSTTNVMLTGYFASGSVTFGTTTLTNAGGEDIFIASYNPSTNTFPWAQRAGGASNERGCAISSPGNGVVAATGMYTSSPTTFGSTNLSSAGAADVFVTALLPTTGSYVWTIAAQGNDASIDDIGRGIAYTTNGSGNVYICGQFAATLTAGTSVTSAGSVDIFFAKLLAPPPLVATQSQVNLTCNGVCTGSATVVASGGVSPYTYSWSPSGGSGATASSLCATNYTVTITDAVSTSITRTFTITQPLAITVTPAPQTNVSCFGGSNGAASVTASGGTGTLTYNWTPNAPVGDLTPNASGLTAQVYTVTVTDANSCTATRTFNITQPSSALATTGGQMNITCFGGATGSATVTVTGGTPTYNYNWTPGNPSGNGSNIVTGLTAQVYTVTVTDFNGCQTTHTFNITQPSTAVSGTTAVTNVFCFGGSNGTINLTPTGGTGPYTFNWLPSGPTTEDRTLLAAGTYSVQITDALGCTGTVTATVTQPAAPVSGTTAVTNVFCFGGSNGAINLTPTGGTGPYTFNWLPSGPTTEDRTLLTAGTYSVQITDALGCTGTVTATVTQPTAAVSGTTAVTNVFCFGGSNGTINLTPTGGTGPYTFNWLPSGPTTEDRTLLAAGTYSVQITDALGCTGTVTATVTQPTAAVSGTTAVTNVFCFGGSNGAINLTPTGGTGPYTFNWLPSGPTTEDRTLLTAGTYSVQITDALGCTGTVTATVTQPTAAVSGTTAVTNVFCFGGSNGAINLTPTGGTGPYTFNWLPSGPTTEDRTLLAAGTYSVQITDALGCTGTVTATVTQPPLLVITGTQTNITCNALCDGSITVNVTGGTPAYTYVWLPSGGNTATATGLCPGTYTITVTDANGCTAIQTFIITQPPAIVVTAASQTNVSCFGGSSGSASVIATGGTGAYSYAWTPTGGTSATATGLIIGNYTCTVIDANLCTSTATFLITEPPALTFTTAHTDVSCHGGSDGDAMVVVSGGTGTYTYMWSPSGGNTNIASGLTFGSYTCTITDANFCTVNATVTIAEPPVITYASMQTNVSCFGGNDGDAMVMASGGTGTLTYLWAPSGGTAALATGLTAGNYTCTITDANFCTVNATFLITAPTAITFTTTQINLMCNGNNSGSASVTASGGTGAYTYTWIPSGGNLATATGLGAGNYTCTITDANSCSVNATFLITEPTVITFTATQTNISCNGANDGSAMVVASGGTGAYTYLWAPSGGTAALATGLAIGNYTCTITDANGCTTDATFLITEPAVLTATTMQNDPTCVGANTGDAMVMPSGGTGTYTYLWAPSGGTGQSEFNLGAGNYTCTITDANGCTTTATFLLVDPAAITFTSTQTDVSCNGGIDGSATVSASGGTGSLSYLWSPSGGNAATATGLAAGNYICTITDANLCSTTATFLITAPVALSASVVGTTNPSVCGATDGSIDISVTGGTASYTFAWSNSDVTEDLTGVGAGSYSVIITDANGCTTTTTGSISDPGAPTVTLALSIDTACGDFPGVINLTGESPAGGTFSGTTVAGNTFDPFSAGPGLHYITYTFTDISGCTGTATDSIFVSTCIGIESITASQQWNLFPNPTNGLLTISSPQNVNGNVLIQVLGTDGKLIISETKSDTKNMTIDLSEQPVGIYFIRITGNESVSVYRIVKI